MAWDNNKIDAHYLESTLYNRFYMICVFQHLWIEICCLVKIHYPRSHLNFRSSQWYSWGYPKRYTEWKSFWSSLKTQACRRCTRWVRSRTQYTRLKGLLGSSGCWTSLSPGLCSWSKPTDCPWATRRHCWCTWSALSVQTSARAYL